MSDLNVNNFSAGSDYLTIRKDKSAEEDIAKSITTLLEQMGIDLSEQEDGAEINPQKEMQIRITDMFKNANSSENGASSLYRNLVETTPPLPPILKEMIDKGYTEATGLAPPQINDSLMAPAAMAPAIENEAKKTELAKNPFGLK